MQFSELAIVFESLEKTASRLVLTEKLAQMYHNASVKDVKHITYLCQGILVPESEGIQLGIGDKLAEQAIGRIAGKSQKEVEELYRKEGDLGAAAEKLLQKRIQSTLQNEELTVKKVYENFYRIATSSGSGSQDLKVKLLSELLSNAEPMEAKHIVRFVQGSLRLGVAEPTILDALSIYWLGRIIESASKMKIENKEYSFHSPKLIFEEAKKEKKAEPSSMKFEAEVRIENAKKGEKITIISKKGSLECELISLHSQGKATVLSIQVLNEKRKYREIFDRAFNLRTDLGDISETIFAERIGELASIEPRVFSPIRPALAERLLTPEQIIEKIGKCSVEGKYDGFRLQIHKKGEQVKIFSRKEEPMTHMFPDIVDAVKREFSAKDAIFEGEAIAVDEKGTRYLPFQVTIQRKRKHDIGLKAKEIPLKLFAFELLFADGTDYTNIPYEERRTALEGMIHKNSKMIKIADRIIAEKPQQLQKYFEDSLKKGLEGIIAKDLNAKYIAGARKFAWIKLKKSYGKSVDTFDVVIIGYYFGKGKRTQFEFGGVLTAVYDPASNKFKSIAKVGTGFSEEQMQEFAAALEKIALKGKPPSVECEMKPDVWVEPKIVIEVNADEITKSPTHTAGKSAGEEEGFALRFPRMISLRKDKKAQDATSEAEIFEMFELQQQK